MNRLKGLLGLLFMVVIAYVLWQVVPAMFNNYQFEDIMVQEARTSSYNSRNEQEIREIILQKAKELNIPITREQVRVQRNGTMVSISVGYKIHVDVPLYPFEMTFNPSTQNKGM